LFTARRTVKITLQRYGVSLKPPTAQKRVIIALSERKPALGARWCKKKVGDFAKEQGLQWLQFSPFADLIRE
jgi:hypothetical protein